MRMRNHSTARVALLKLHERKLGLNACETNSRWLECVRDEFTIKNGELTSYQVIRA